MGYTQGSMKKLNAGFQEVEHTADWQLHVWAPDMVSLLEQSARGMYQLSHTKFYGDGRLRRKFNMSIVDRETLLVDFLSELLFYGEDENIAFDGYQLEIRGNTLRAQVSGAPIAEQAKEIKAVTYHCLEVQDSKLGLEVQIVFDV